MLAGDMSKHTITRKAWEKRNSELAHLQLKKLQAAQASACREVLVAKRFAGVLLLGFRGAAHSAAGFPA